MVPFATRPTLDRSTSPCHFRSTLTALCVIIGSCSGSNKLGVLFRGNSEEPCRPEFPRILAWGCFSGGPQRSHTLLRSLKLLPGGHPRSLALRGPLKDPPWGFPRRLLLPLLRVVGVLSTIRSSSALEQNKIF